MSGRMVAFGWRAAGYTPAESGEVDEFEQVIPISEGWMSTGECRPPKSRPSQDPARKEVLLVSNLTIRDHRSRVVIFEMVRDVKGELTELRDLQLPGEYDQGQAETPLLDAFADGLYTSMIDRGTRAA